MAQHTLIGKRIVKDFLTSVPGSKVANVEVTQELLTAASSGHQRYQQYLDEEKRKAM